MRFIALILMMFAVVSVTFTTAFAAERINGTAGGAVLAEEYARFSAPWAMTFIDDSRLLVTTKSGRLWLVDTASAPARMREVAGVPPVAAGGQGGLGDVVLHPGFTTNRLVYLSFAASGDGGATRYAKVVRARLDAAATALTDMEDIWEQRPAVSGQGHFSHRIVFAPAASPLAGSMFITSGDRQKLQPAQDMGSALGKLIRLADDGSIPDDNPYQRDGAVARTFWSIGHRNSLGIAFDGAGNLWAHEMGPRHGDELNLIAPGQNYGWPLVSEGSHYSGRPIPDHATNGEFTAPEIYWVPTIAPAGLVFYTGDMFPAWQGNALIGGLRSRALIRVGFRDGGLAPYEAERFEWGARVREVEVAPDGAVFVLEDGGRLLRLTAP